MFTGNHIYKISELLAVGAAAAMSNSEGGGGKMQVEVRKVNGNCFSSQNSTKGMVLQKQTS